ncbi:MAG: low molecular weight protein-tyrosine-phosphatase [Actinomycetaceae bacterium]|nr:low molecular weight protein-tyrosine-phosphatase [Actinomycetaceae bacterium]
MDSMRQDLASKPHILVVCTGNICRSPMGEVVLRARIEDAGLPYGVSSCGVSDEEHGRGIDAPAARALRDAGYEVPAHRAHRATRAELEEAGLILAMTTGHARALRRMCEQASVPASRIHLWREFDGSGLDVAPEGCFGPGGALAQDGSSGRRHSDFYYSYGEWDVVDPWGGGPSEFAETLDVVERGASGIVAALRG